MQFEFYSRFAKKMMGVCRRYTASKMEAEDQLQESFVLVFKNLDQFKDGSLEGWIRRIVVNQCIGHFRKQKTKIHWIESLDESTANQIPGDDSAWVEQVNAEQLMIWIGLLPPGAKTVFNLAAIEGFEHHEIAKMLGIAESASRSQLSRARQALQKMYKQTIKQQANGKCERT